MSIRLHNLNGPAVVDNLDDYELITKPKVFAIGDVRNTPLCQVITAVSDGAVAAVYAGKYMESLAPAQSV